MAALRFVRIEWDRGAETVRGVIRCEAADGIVVEVLRDLVPIGESMWIAEREILSVEEADDDAPEVRLAARRGYEVAAISPEFGELPMLVEQLHLTQRLAGVYTTRWGSDTIYIGAVTAVTNESFTVELVSTDGTWENDRTTYPWSDVIGLSWGGPYHLALAELAGEMPPGLGA